MWNLRRIMLVVFSIALLYLIGIFSIYIGINFLIFSPKPVHENYAFSFSGNAQEIKLEHPDKSYIVNHFLLPKSAPAAAVMILHDGQKNAEYFAEYAEIFIDRGFAVLMVDYRSFGKSKGNISEIGCMEDGLISLQWLHSKFHEDRIVIYGIGLGSFVAAYLSSIFPARYAVLEDPIYDLKTLLRKRYPSLILPYELKYDFDTHKYLPNTIGQTYLLAIHPSSYTGKKEWQHLKSLLKDRNNFIEIPTPKGEKPIYQNTYIQFLDQLASNFQ